MLYHGFAPSPPPPNHNHRSSDVIVGDLDPVSRKAGEIARYAYGSLMPVAGMMASQIEDVDERRAFNEKALNEFRSGVAPVALVMYIVLK